MSWGNWIWGGKEKKCPAGVSLGVAQSPKVPASGTIVNVRYRTTKVKGAHESSQIEDGPIPSLPRISATDRWKDQRADVTPTCRHISNSGQVEHFGRVPVQTCLPNGTSRALISTQYDCGNFACNASIVFSGVRVST
jgi:hypothetical protein